MEKYFRQQDGELVNMIEHTMEQLQFYPNLKVYIGTDSQVYGSVVRYVTVIVYRYGNNGAHYIYQGDEVPRIKDDFLRLYNEGLRTVEISQYFTEEIPSLAIEQLEFDYAGIKKTLSSALVSVFKGYLKARFKGGEMIATKAADHVCRNYREHRNKWRAHNEDEFKNKLRVA
jgi:predicted RNase H-related nuclease YkuK (DUF458 family)